MPKTKAAPPRPEPPANRPVGPDAELDNLVRYVRLGCAALRDRLERDIAAQSKSDRAASELAHVYGALRDVGDEIAASLKVVTDAVGTLGTEYVPQAFERENLSTFTTKDGYRVSVSQRYVASIRPDKKDEAKDWLRANGLDALIIETVNASTLSSAGKSMIEDQGKELPEELFNAAFLPGTSLTRTKKS